MPVDGEGYVSEYASTQPAAEDEFDLPEGDIYVEQLGHMAEAHAQDMTSKLISDQYATREAHPRRIQEKTLG